MSFSTDVKSELCEQMPKARHCLEAEAIAMLLVAGRRYTSDDGRGTMGIRTENMGVASKFFTILGKGLRINEVVFQTINGTGRDYNQIGITGEADVQRLNALADRRHYLEKSCCRRAFLRGAFLASGSISDPLRYYRLEIVCPDQFCAEAVSDVMCRSDLNVKMTERKGMQVVYLQDSDDIARVLGLMGSSRMLMEFENIRIIRERKGTINRKVNCEIANLERTVSAARRQIEDIEYLQREGILEGLPGNLQQIAKVRLQYPEVSLQELGQLMVPTVGKSGVNHRLRKLSELAEKDRLTRTK